MAAIKLSKTKRRTLKPWAKIKTAYLTSSDSVTTICKQYKVSRTSLQKRADAEGWTRTVTKSEICRRSATQQHQDRLHRATTDTQEGAFAMLVDSGMSINKAAQAVCIKSATANRLAKKQNSLDKNGSKLLKKSVIAARCALSGNRLGGDPILDPATGEQALDPETGLPIYKGGVTFKGSDVVKMITHMFDRINPVVKTTVNASVTFMPINLDDYR
jgi:hypothetical protein